ncbi:odorant receptor 7a-like [Rhagoletis pomonella]|uniref:odorant receptor 7a-like n=1 Tax=Rhagoletis pomonella TaxID=28610 RepID=UPI0017855959|nr:odorant receptor 7a-like [Rhagoletis pomonella]XP_036345775.1 odorant receptor 7a-like [Rhagoletis pomonella]
MFDLLKGRGRSVFSSRDAVIYLFNIFRLVGVNPQPNFRILNFLYGGILTFAAVFYSPIMLTLSWMRYRDILSMTEILMCIQTNVNTFGLPFKSTMLILSLARLRSVEPLLTELDARYTEARDKAKIRSCAIIGNRIVFFYTLVYMTYAVSWMISAVLRGHPLFALWIPYVEWQRSTWEYWLQFSFDCTTALVILFHQVLNDCYPVVYINIIRTQVQLLANRVKRLGTVANKSQEDTNVELKECIITHQDILRLVGNVKPIISVTMFAQLLITATILAVTMINIFIFAKATSRVISIIYLVNVFLQISTTCYFASCLQTDCERLSMSIFHCNWVAQDKRFKKMLLYFLQCSQENIPLFAMKLVSIDLSVIVSIAKFSFTLYTFIQKMGIDRSLKN